MGGGAVEEVKRDGEGGGEGRGGGDARDCEIVYVCGCREGGVIE